MRVYLDMCCYNRPYDDQSQLKVAMETQSKLYIQSLIKEKKSECMTEKYSRHWWDYDIKSFQVVREFNESRKQGEHVTDRGTDSLGALQFGSQAVRVTREFAQFIMDKIGDLQ